MKEDLNEEYIMYIYVSNEKLTCEMVNNSATQALKEKLKESDIEISMSDYGNFEKVGDLGFSLPRCDEDIDTNYGDLILYLGSRFVIYYDTNSWNFTRLGKIKDISQEKLKSILGENDVYVKLSLQ